ncbi:hypothetical protein GT354_00935 [Streptomyces sp. SID3343]|nr:hypothetical protein [Streptomyces sp. SID3343]
MRKASLALEDRVLMAALYLRTNLTMRQLGPLFGVSARGSPPHRRPPQSLSRARFAAGEAAGG